jgi:acyl dehydratase
LRRLNPPVCIVNTETSNRPWSHFHLCPQRWFDDFSVGEEFPLPSRTMTSALFSAFQLASGDNHPLHYDAAYCRRLGMPDMLAHGFQIVIQTAAGAGLFPHMVQESLKAFLEQSSRFLAPVFCGDTLYPMLTVRSVQPGRTTGVLVLESTVLNQDKTLVMVGEHKYLLRRRPAATSS